MDKQKALEIMDDAICIWNELHWFNGKHRREASLFLGNHIQLVDERILGACGSLAEDIADALNLTRTYLPCDDGSGLCKFEYKGYGFFSGWRDCK